MKSMTPQRYRALRDQLGLTQELLARELGLTRITIIRREAGQLPITREAALAIERLVEAREPRAAR